MEYDYDEENDDPLEGLPHKRPGYEKSFLGIMFFWGE